MISEAQFQKELDLIIENAIREDVGPGDYSSLACIPATATGKAKLLVKEDGIIAGVAFAKMVFKYVDPNLQVETFIEDGAAVKFGDVVFHVSGSSQSILKAERLVLNSMQRMSAIATKTKSYVQLLEGTKTKVLDTRKTTPGFRACEKWAVKIGGGENHRFALYDMVMLKDNHIDFAGGITLAIAKTKAYLKENNLDLKIIIEYHGSIWHFNPNFKYKGTLPFGMNIENHKKSDEYKKNLAIEKGFDYFVVFDTDDKDLKAIELANIIIEKFNNKGI